MYEIQTMAGGAYELACRCDKPGRAVKLARQISASHKLPARVVTPRGRTLTTFTPAVSRRGRPTAV